MSKDWKPGDLARHVGSKPDCPTCCGTIDLPHLDRGDQLVIQVIGAEYAVTTCGLVFLGLSVALCSCAWIKLPPRAPDVEDEITIKLLVKAPVPEPVA